jgi:hypothetical protein
MKFPAQRKLKQKAQLLLIIPLGLLFLHLASSPVFAQCPADTTETLIGCLPNTVDEAKEHLYCIMLNIITLVAVIVLVIGGYRLLTAGDDKDALREAQGHMVAAVSGLVFFLISAQIIRIILGIEMLALPLYCNVT